MTIAKINVRCPSDSNSQRHKSYLPFSHRLEPSFSMFHRRVALLAKSGKMPGCSYCIDPAWLAAVAKVSDSSTTSVTHDSPRRAFE